MHDSPTPTTVQCSAPVVIVERYSVIFVYFTPEMFGFFQVHEFIIDLFHHFLTSGITVLYKYCGHGDVGDGTEVSDLIKTGYHLEFQPSCILYL